MDHSWMYAPSNSSNSAGGTPADSGGLSAFAGANSPENVAKASHGQPRIRRRNRLINSCLECRRRKLKCDKTAPCTNCTRFKRDCLYLAPSSDPNSQQKLAEIKERMGALEKTLEAEVAGQQTKKHIGGANVSRASGEGTGIHVEGDEEDDLGAEDEENLEPTPLAALDNVYGEENADDEIMDLGVQMGKMRISERIGGWIRPKLVEELTETLDDVTGWKKTNASAAQIQNLRPGGTEAKIQASPKSYIGPGPDYIAPTSSFFFPGTNMNTTLIDYLPSKNAADQLIAQYFYVVHYIARAVHRQTFEAQYANFWGQIATGTEPVPSQQAVVFAAMFSAAVSMTEDQVGTRFGTSKAALIDSLRSGTEMALSKANFLRTTKTDTMQAFVMYLIPLIRAEVSRAHSALVGTAIRLAECMGLHRDGTNYAMTPVEVHVRRIIWHQLCFLDMRTCEATGPRPQIRKDDYDTRMPLNVNDADLLETPAPTEDKPYWTDATIFKIRSEVTEMRRTLWFDIVQVDKKKKSLTSTVVKVQKLRTHLVETYLPMMDESVPLHMVGKHVMYLGLNGCFLQVLHRYLFSTTTRMPDRLRQILIESGVAQMENSIALETKPELAPWAWYRGAFNQYHSALLLLVEVYAYPMRKDAARIWKCLDYIFEIPSHLSPKQKAELVITDLRDRMEVYRQMRKIRTTTQMEERVDRMRIQNRDSTSPAQTNILTGFNLQQDPTTQSAMAGLLPVNFSPPPPAPSDSSRGSRQGSVPWTADQQMNTMEDIDWAEWDKYFPIEQNSGDLNIPDFNIAEFTGDFNNQTLSSAPDGTTSAGDPGMINIPSAQELADVNFTPTFYPGNMPNSRSTYYG